MARSALTTGLTFCLGKDAAAARAFTQLIRERTTLTDLPSPDRWEAESVTDAGERADIVGWVGTEAARAPVVVVEAKVSANFENRQVSSYVNWQEPMLRGVGFGPGATVVLVPEGRVSAASNEVAADLARLLVTKQGDAWLTAGEPGVMVAVVSWDEAIGAMREVAELAASDLDQLLGACWALHGIDVPAFTKEDLEDWQAREG